MVISGWDMVIRVGYGDQWLGYGDQSQGGWDPLEGVAAQLQRGQSPQGLCNGCWEGFHVICCVQPQFSKVGKGRRAGWEALFHLHHTHTVTHAVANARYCRDREIQFELFQMNLALP